jgi:hypothetical protein
MLEILINGLLRGGAVLCRRLKQQGYAWSRKPHPYHGNGYTADGTKQRQIQKFEMLTSGAKPLR